MSAAQRPRSSLSRPSRSRRSLLAALSAVPAVFAAGALTTRGAPMMRPTNAPARVLLVTATTGYYHDSIPTAQRVVDEIATRSGDLTVNLLGNAGILGWLNAATLAEHDVLFFANTSGELPLDGAQMQA